MNSKSYNIFTIFFIFVILECACSYITKSLLSGYLTLLSLLCFTSFFLVYKERKALSLISFITYGLLSYGLMYSYDFDLNWIIIAVLKFLPVLTLFMLPREDLLVFKDKIIRFFLILIFASVVLYILKIIGILLPVYEKMYWHQYEIVNYFYIYTDSVRYLSSFTGFCIETGYFSFLCICLLALEEFDLRKRTSQIFTLAILLSMSLEGYILLVVGIILYSISRGENIGRTIKYFVLATTILVISVTIVMNYNGGDNIVAEKIVERLTYDEELGIVGNNRESEEAAKIIDRYFYSNDVWLGIRHSKYVNVLAKYGYDVCSWRQFVIIYGAIYTIVVFVFSFLCLSKTNIKKTFPFFVIYWLDFIIHAEISSESLFVLIIIFLLNKKTYNDVFYTNKNISI